MGLNDYPGHISTSFCVRIGEGLQTTTCNSRLYSPTNQYHQSCHRFKQKLVWQILLEMCFILAPSRTHIISRFFSKECLYIFKFTLFFREKKNNLINIILSSYHRLSLFKQKPRALFVIFRLFETHPLEDFL